MKLTNGIIDKIPANGKEQELSDSDLTGLKVRVSKSGTKTFYFNYKNSEGKKRKYRIGKFGDIGLPKAREIARQLHGQVANNEDPQGARVQKRKKVQRESRVILKNFLEDEYYPSKHGQRSLPRTKQILNANFKHLMNKEMSSLTRLDIERYKRDRKRAGVQQSTINRELTAIHAVINYAVEIELIRFNPLGKHKRKKEDDNAVERWLSPAEEKRLYKAMEKRSGHLPVLVKLLLHTGARPREAFTLTWSNVDLVNKRITLERTYTKTGIRRHIPLNATIHKVLSDWKQLADTEWLFPNQSKTGHIVTVQKGWRLLKAEAKLKNFRLYDCRHTFASKLVMNGTPIYEVSLLLGHSSIEMTKRYAHLAPEHLQSAVDRIA